MGEANWVVKKIAEARAYLERRLGGPIDVCEASL